MAGMEGTQATGGHAHFTPDELAAIRGVFNMYDTDGSETITVQDTEALLHRIGKQPDEVVALMQSFAKIGDMNDGRVSFAAFVDVLASAVSDRSADMSEEADPKVLEFLRILEEYRIKCEEEGNYLEAARAQKQLENLRVQEERRQRKAIRARQLAERQDVQLAHNMQYTDFDASWTKYMEEYDNMAQMYIQQMTERHAQNLMEFQKQLRKELASKPPRWSRELLDVRRRQHILARQKNYAEAERIKKKADRVEQKERKRMDESQASVFGRRESKFRQHQQAELQALLKRIEGRRKEHIKQRNIDSKRLLQRNRNVQAVLESKQAVEQSKLFAEIKKRLYQRSYGTQRMSSTDSSMRSTKKRSKKRTQHHQRQQQQDRAPGAEDDDRYVEEAAGSQTADSRLDDSGPHIPGPVEQDPVFEQKDSEPFDAADPSAPEVSDHGEFDDTAPPAAGAELPAAV